MPQAGEAMDGDLPHSEAQPVPQRVLTVAQVLVATATPKPIEMIDQAGSTIPYLADSTVPESIACGKDARGQCGIDLVRLGPDLSKSVLEPVWIASNNQFAMRWRRGFYG